MEAEATESFCAVVSYVRLLHGVLVYSHCTVYSKHAAAHQRHSCHTISPAAGTTCAASDDKYVGRHDRSSVMPVYAFAFCNVLQRCCPHFPADNPCSFPFSVTRCSAFFFSFFDSRGRPPFEADQRSSCVEESHFQSTNKYFIN